MLSITVSNCLDKDCLLAITLVEQFGIWSIYFTFGLCLNIPIVSYYGPLLTSNKPCSSSKLQGQGQWYGRYGHGHTGL